jgi:hypothetical protein
MQQGGGIHYRGPNFQKVYEKYNEIKKRERERERERERRPFSKETTADAEK